MRTLLFPLRPPAAPCGPLPAAPCTHFPALPCRAIGQIGLGAVNTLSSALVSSLSQTQVKPGLEPSPVKEGSTAGLLPEDDTYDEKKIDYFEVRGGLVLPDIPVPVVLAGPSRRSALRGPVK
jgi:hypothetical protein